MLTRLLGCVAATVATAGLGLAQSAPPATLPKAKPATPIAPPALTPMPSKEAAKPATPATPAANAAAAAAVTTPASQMLANGCAPACAESCNPCCCVPCGPPGRVWIDAGFLWYHTSGQNTPPLVTAAPAGSPRETAGALGQPGTTVLFPSNGTTNGDWRGGFYVNAGFWCDECQTRGFETNFFYLGPQNDNYAIGSPGQSIITRPFFNATTGQQDIELVSTPNILAGAVNVNSSTNVWGINPNYISNCCCGPCGRFDVLLGFYYLNVSDNLVITENLTSLPGQTDVPPGTRFIVQDSFSTNNDFYGVNLGFAFERRFSHWYIGARGGVVFGVNHQTVDINGTTIRTLPGGSPEVFTGGLLAQPSNIGHYERDMFAVMPWIGLRLGCQVTERMRAYVGYDYYYLSNVVRAGEQIDPRVNTTQIPGSNVPVTGASVPAFNWNDNGFSITGIRIGMELRF